MEVSGQRFRGSHTLKNVEGYHVENFGCRASHADGDALEAELSRAGRRAVSAADADLVVLNTCAVTAEAEKTARAYLRRVRRENPKAKVVVTGCYAQRAPEEVARLAGVDAVVGNSHKGLLGEVAARLKEQAAAGRSAGLEPHSRRDGSGRDGPGEQRQGRLAPPLDGAAEKGGALHHHLHSEE